MKCRHDWGHAESLCIGQYLYTCSKCGARKLVNHYMGRTIICFHRKGEDSLKVAPYHIQVNKRW